MQARERIIVALDVPGYEEATGLIRALGSEVGMFKLGKRAITAGWHADLIDWNRDRLIPCRIFLDGKFNDIPNTVGEAAAEAAKLGVHFFNVHASAGVKAMAAAVANKSRAKVLAVTVLTSLDREQCKIIFGGTPGEVVMRFALMAKDAGVDGLICSPQEIVMLRAEPALKDTILVAPGIRLAGTGGKDDQERVATPGGAIVAGADYIVVGRPITTYPADKGGPVEGARLIAADIEQALAEKAPS